MEVINNKLQREVTSAPLGCQVQIIKRTKNADLRWGMKEPRNAPVVFFGYIEKKSIIREWINHEVQNKNVNRVLIQRVFFSSQVL